MSAESAFRCPVCRARQTLSETCRRCQADLRLVVGARRRLNYLLAQQTAARASGDRQREETIAAELNWLAPSH